MPLYRVTLRQWHHLREEGPFFNPFRSRDIWRKRPCTHRIWEFEAADEDEVRRLFSEAKATDCDNVRGFELISIEAVAEKSPA